MGEVIGVASMAFGCVLLAWPTVIATAAYLAYLGGVHVTAFLMEITAGVVQACKRAYAYVHAGAR